MSLIPLTDPFCGHIGSLIFSSFFSLSCERCYIDSPSARTTDLILRDTHVWVDRGGNDERRDDLARQPPEETRDFRRGVRQQQERARRDDPREECDGVLRGWRPLARREPKRESPTLCKMAHNLSLPPSPRTHPPEPKRKRNARTIECPMRNTGTPGSRSRIWRAHHSMSRSCSAQLVFP